MKTGFIGLVCLVCSLPVLAEFHDPMRPPPLALQKFRMEKIKKVPVSRTQARPDKNRSLELNSILYSSQRKHAIINNKLVKKGDIISGAKLIRVQPQSVRLISKGKIIDLSLKTRYKSIRKSVGKKKS